MKSTPPRAVMFNLGLPMKIPELIKRGKLEETVLREYAAWEAAQAALAQWETLNPEAASRAPWAAQRQAWKDAGCPRPEWWEVIQELDFLGLFNNLYTVQVCCLDRQKAPGGKEWNAANVRRWRAKKKAALQN